MSFLGFAILGLFSFVFLISIVVVIHELGHYWAGRICGVHAETFSMGFGPTLYSWRDKHGTVWRVAALPLGGYVKFLGDAGAASEPDADKLEEIRARMGADADKCYHFKPIWQRAFITAAGPIANFILAIAIFGGLAMVQGVTSWAPVVGFVGEGTPAEEAGFQTADRVVAINGGAVRRFNDITKEVSWRPGEDLSFTIERSGEQMTIIAASRMVTVTDRFDGERQMAQIGLGVPLSPQIGRIEAGSEADQAGLRPGDTIVSIDGSDVVVYQTFEQLILAADDQPHALRVLRDGREFDLTVTLPRRPSRESTEDSPYYGPLGIRPNGALEQVNRYNPIEAVGYGARQTWSMVSMTARYVSYVVTGRSPTSMLNGPLGIFEVAGQTARVSVEQGENAGDSALKWLANMIQLAGFLSVGLGLVNLLPIPILDGGHLVYYAYEAVAGRPLSMKAQAIGFRVGLALVLGMMLLATWNDINYKLSQFF